MNRFTLSRSFGEKSIQPICDVIALFVSVKCFFVNCHRYLSISLTLNNLIHITAYPVHLDVMIVLGLLNGLYLIDEVQEGEGSGHVPFSPDGYALQDDIAALVGNGQVDGKDC